MEPREASIVVLAALVSLGASLVPLEPQTVSAESEGEPDLRVSLDETSVLVRVLNPSDQDTEFSYWFGDFLPRHHKFYLWETSYYPLGIFEKGGFAGFPILDSNHPLVQQEFGWKAWKLFQESPPDYEDRLLAPPGETFFHASTHRLKGEITISSDGPLVFEVVAIDQEMRRMRWGMVADDWDNWTHINVLTTGILGGNSTEEIRYPYNFQLFTVDTNAEFRMEQPDGYFCEGNQHYVSLMQPPGEYSVEAFSMGWPGLSPPLVFWLIVDVPVDVFGGLEPNQICG